MSSVCGRELRTTWLEIPLGAQLTMKGKDSLCGGCLCPGKETLVAGAIQIYSGSRRDSPGPGRGKDNKNERTTENS